MTLRTWLTLLCTSLPLVASAAESIETLAVVRELEELQVPARREGLIDELTVRRGMQVVSGQLLCRQSTNDISLKLNVTKAEKLSARAKAENRGPIEVALSAVKKARVERKLISELGEHAVYLEHFRIENSLEKALAELQTAESHLHQDELQVDVKDAEIAVLSNDIKQMEVHAPATGVIRDVLKHQGEWVKQGEGIVLLTRMDKLLVEGFLDSKSISPNDATGLPAKVKFALAGKKTAEFDGLVIDQTAPKLELDGKFPVWVIIENRQMPDKAGMERWLIRPGMTGMMTIELE